MPNVGTLLDSLLAILRLDFACARLNDSIDGSPVEVSGWPNVSIPLLSRRKSVERSATG